MYVIHLYVCRIFYASISNKWMVSILLSTWRSPLVAGHVLPSLKGCDPPSAASRSSTCSLALGAVSRPLLRSFSQNAFIHKKMSHNRIVTQLFHHTPLFHTRKLEHTALSHTTLIRKSISHNHFYTCFSQNFFTGISFTQKFPDTIFTRNFVEYNSSASLYCCIQLFHTHRQTHHF